MTPHRCNPLEKGKGVVNHGRYPVFQLAAVAARRERFPVSSRRMPKFDSNIGEDWANIMTAGQGEVATIGEKGG